MQAVPFGDFETAGIQSIEPVGMVVEGPLFSFAMRVSLSDGIVYVRFSEVAGFHLGICCESPFVGIGMMLSVVVAPCRAPARSSVGK